MLKKDRLEKSRKETEALLTKVGFTHLKEKYKGKKRRVNKIPDYKTKENAPLSNGFANAGFKKSVDDYKWKKDRSETKETIEAIEKKKKQISIPYNKGPAMVILPGEEKFLGRK